MLAPPVLLPMLALLSGCALESSLLADEPVDAHLDLASSNNYAYDATFEIQSVVIPARTDAVVQWGELSVDMIGHPVEEDISSIALVWYPHLDEAEVERLLVLGTMLQEDMGAIFTLNPDGRTEAALSEFTLLGHAMNPEEYLLADDGVWLVAALPKTGSGARMVTFMRPVDGAPATPVALRNDSAELTLDVALGEPIVVAPSGPWSVEWTGLTTAGTGLDFSRYAVDTLWVARFEDLDPDALADHFLDADLLALDAWTAPIGGVAGLDDLSAATDAGGRAFPGFDDASTWVVALRCMRCTSPAPPFVGVVDAR